MKAPTVSVTATAEREVLPDSFSITASVTGYGTDAAAAGAELAARYTELEDAAAGFGAALDVRRGQVQSWHDPYDKNRRGVEWQAQRHMTVTGGDVAAAGDVVAALGRLAEVHVNGPSWGVRRDNPVYAELQTDVVHAARERAERYAAALGGTLGPLLQLSVHATVQATWRLVLPD